MLNVLIKSTQVALCLHSQDHGGEQGCRGTRPTPGSLAGQAAATLLELLCSPLFVKSSLYCPLCYIPVKSDLIILLFRSLHDLRYSVKVLINLQQPLNNRINLFPLKEMPGCGTKGKFSISVSDN